MLKRIFFIVILFFVAVFPATMVAAPAKKTTIERINPSEIEAKISARAYVVMDRATGKILTMKQENLVWPMASITKLMTAEIVLAKKISPKKIQSVLKTDDVGGAKLFVKDRDTFTIDDLFYAMLVGSANNAANALARASGLSPEAFVASMNQRAKDLGLKQTQYVDQSGMDPGNVSTVLELAKIANNAFSNLDIKKYTSTSVRNIRVQNTRVIKKIKSTNWMLYQSAYDAIYVTSGKTGYLEESGWNLATTLKPNKKGDTRELLLVIFGSDSRINLFQDAKTLSEWAWKSYRWKK